MSNPKDCFEEEYFRQIIAALTEERDAARLELATLRAYVVAPHACPVCHCAAPMEGRPE